VASSGESKETTDDKVEGPLRTLLDQLIVRCEGLEAGAAKVDSLANAQADFRTTAEAVAAIDRRLDELSARLAPLEKLPTRLVPLEKLPTRLESLETAPRPAPAPAQKELAAMDEGVKALDGRLSSLEEVAKKVTALDQERGRLAALDKVLAGLVQGGERLTGRVDALEAAPVPETASPGRETDPAELKVLSDRVAALEGAPPIEPPVPAALVKQMERLIGQVATLQNSTTRLAALEGVPDRLVTLEKAVATVESKAERAGPKHDLEAVTAHLQRLTAEVAPLRAVPKRVESIERVQGRVNAIDKSLATLTRSVGDLSVKVAATATSTVEPETKLRIEALDAVSADLAQTVNELSSRVAGLDEVPKRVEALEQSSAPSEKLVASVAKRVDRLSTQSASVKELPERVEALERAMSGDRRQDQTTEQVKGIAQEVKVLHSALEVLVPRLQALEAATGAVETPNQSPDRSDALAVGLGHAIDMIDQLAHQVAVLESRAQG
jgi:chromosome segregation ATPase